VRHRLLPLIVVVLTAGCGSPLSVSDGVFTVRRDANALTLLNGASTPAFYIAVERETATGIDWVACVEDPCQSVAPRSFRRVPDPEIVGFREEATQAVVYYWRAVPDGAGGVTAGEIRQFTIDL